MRRSLVVGTAAALVVVGAVAGTGNAQAGRQKVQRQESTGYVGGRGTVPGGAPEIYLDEGVFETLAYERHVSVEINDRTGQAVAALVRQDADADGVWEVEEAICGTTDDPVRIAGGADVVVKVQPGPCADGTPAVMTSGSIAVTFTGRG